MFYIAIILVSIILVYFSYLFLKLKWKLSYWKRKGLEYVEPELFLGSARKHITKEISTGDQLLQYYKYFKSRGQKHGGAYLGSMPVYVPVDPDLIKQIVQKDFDHFINRTHGYDEEEEPLQQNLLHLQGEKWKNLRAKLSPTFTSGKMKMMFPTMVSCIEGLKDILDEHVILRDPIDIKDALERYTMDIIGSVAFGIDCNTLKNPNSDFRRYGKKIFEDHPRTFKHKLLKIMPKKFLKKLGFSFKETDPEVENFFMNIVDSTVRYREANNISRKDVLHLLLQLKNKGEVTEDEKLFSENSDKPGHFLKMSEVAAQCFVFFGAGFATSATTMTFALLELGLNPDIQEKLRAEINEVLEKHNNQVTYEAIMEMKYLDKVLQETLRKHPAVSVLPRVCNKDYKVPNTNVTIDKGIFLFISINGLHEDPEFYPDPEKFNPERFNKENKDKRKQFTYLPFGEGPRICIGARFGVLQAKVGLVAVIKHVKVTVNEKTKFPIKLDPSSSVNCVDGDVWLNVTKADYIF